jgi:pimeloyl-ACP methyl ester carboxylesterase
MARVDILAAATTLHTSYSGMIPGGRVKYVGADILAILHRNGTLYIPGTDSQADWIRFNLPTTRRPGDFWGVFKGSPIAKDLWFYGFLKYAAWLATAMAPTRPRMIVGHSLGGAVAQVLAAYFQVPALTFAAPRPLAQTKAVAGAERVLNLAHPNDTVTRYPFAPDARTVGKVYRISQGAAGGLVHNLPTYAKYLRPDIAAGKLIPHWPLVESRSAARSGGT